MRLAPIGVAAMSIAAAPALAPADHAAIEAAIAAQTDAWNRHDMHAFAAVLTPDADWINVVGMHWRGREAIERAHAALHAMPLFAHSRLIPGETTMRALSPDVVLVVERSAMEGAGPTPGGGAYPTGGAIGTFLFVRTAAGWRIAHGHNTTIDAAATAHDPGARRPG